MAESYDNLQGSEMKAEDHPDNNIDHPSPGPRGAAAMTAARIAFSGPVNAYAQAAVVGAAMATHATYSAYKGK